MINLTQVLILLFSHGTNVRAKMKALCKSNNEIIYMCVCNLIIVHNM